MDRESRVTKMKRRKKAPWSKEGRFHSSCHFASTYLALELINELGNASILSDDVDGAENLGDISGGGVLVASEDSEHVGSNDTHWD